MTIYHVGVFNEVTPCFRRQCYLGDDQHYTVQQAAALAAASRSRLFSKTRKLFLTYGLASVLPIGTVAIPVEKSAPQGPYVKTSPSTWAFIGNVLDVAQYWDAIDSKRNNLSPGPSGYEAYLFAPRVR